jgi:predicted transglutaminase-like cysteine proteinase
MILDHAEDCQITRERVELLKRISLRANHTVVPARDSEFWALIGASHEYFDGGDQEVENCTCEATSEELKA